MQSRSSKLSSLEENKPPQVGAVVDSGTKTSKSPKFVEKCCVPSEEEVSTMAAAQAKVWADAEKRALDAHSDVEPLATGEGGVLKPRIPRKPLPWRKVVISATLLLLLALFVAPHLALTKDYVSKLEQVLENKLQQPVAIETLSGRFLPTPRLELNGVSVGESPAVQIERVQIDFSLASIFSAQKSINRVELQAMQLDGVMLQPLVRWLQQLAPDEHYPISRIELTRSKLYSGKIQLADLEGYFEFNPRGEFTAVKLQTGNGKLALEMNSATDDTVAITLNVRDGTLPLLPNWNFADLTATGELSAYELRITDMDSRIFGGVLQGDGRMSWRSSGWKAEGSLIAKTITLENINSILMGNVDGSARFSMQSKSLSTLLDKSRLNGTFTVGKGTINGMDFVETTRLRSLKNLPGGRTHFDRVGGDLSVVGDVIRLRRLKLESKILTVTGSVDVSQSLMSGRASAILSIRSDLGVVPLHLSGTLGIPVLKIGY